MSWEPPIKVTLDFPHPKDVRLTVRHVYELRQGSPLAEIVESFHKQIEELREDCDKTMDPDASYDLIGLNRPRKFLTGKIDRGGFK